MSEIIFFNSGNGDIHYSRQFVKDIISKLGDSNEYYYAHRNKSNILSDIKEITSIPLNERCNCSIEKNVTFYDDDSIYINTWIGQDNRKYLTKGITIDSNYDLFKSIYDILNIKIEENILNYIPTINFNLVSKDGVDEFLNSHNEIKVLICNGIVNSGQSRNFLFEDIIDNISDTYKNIDFILTKESILDKTNIFYTKNITKKDGDLNEISYLSIFCNMIIGRASGPYCFCDIYDNLMDEMKIFLNISIVGNWCEYGKCEMISTREYENLINIINNILKNNIKKWQK